MKVKGLLIAGAVSMSLIGAGAAQAARDYISIVGSSTVYPFATVVAEQFGKSSGFKTPKIESTGSGGGFKLFCAGVGVSHPDITNASRAVKSSELKKCAANGVKDIIEVKIGYDGIVLANSKATKQMELTRKDIFMALAKQVPDPKNPEKMIDNPYMTWKDVNPALPATKIEVLGPPPTSGTRDAFVELAMEGGAKKFDNLKALRKSDKKAFKKIAHTLREDRAYIEAGENDNLIVQKLQASAQAFGILGFSFLDQNTEKVKAAVVDGERPGFETIAVASYPISRPLFFYVKKAHVGAIPGLREFLDEFTSERTWGDEGYLSYRGLVPLSAEIRADVASRVAGLEALSVAHQ